MTTKMFVRTNKVQFQDQQLDDYVLENSVLKSKLQSKIEALLIMSKELDKCCMERDKYKILVEQLKYKKKLQDSTNNWDGFTPTNISGSEILAKTKEHNNMLKLEVETLKNKLEESNGDIIALRKQLQKVQSLVDSNENQKISLASKEAYEQMVQELEKVHKKYQQIQSDYRATLDEKEELISDRDYYKTKVQRMNHQISFILSNRSKSQTEEIDPTKPTVDIDALLAENKYLHERITQLQVEKEILKRTLSKYKILLDNRNKTDPIKTKKGFSDVMTQKQVREFLDINSKSGFKRSSAAELKSLCLGLFEALNDKSIALQHQRKTNQILANRITELEKTLESWCNGQKCIPIFPSHMLIEELLNDSASVKSDESREISDHNTYVNKITYKNSEGNIDNGKVEISEDDSEVKSLSSKIVLPQELQELVKEALAELKYSQ